MTLRNKTLSKKNKWFDSQTVDSSAMTTEQEYNDSVDTSIFKNHFGNGLLPESFSQNLIFDTSLINDVLDKYWSPNVNAISDTSSGCQLELKLEDSLVSGRRSVKVAIFGLDFNGNIQSDTFFFYKNESKITSKHYVSVIKVFINDMSGSTIGNKSLNLGGRLTILEAKQLFVSTDEKMVAQDIQPNLFWRDFYVITGDTLNYMFTQALPGYDVSSIIYTDQLDTKLLSDTTTIIGQKFLARTSNIQKVTLLLSSTTSTWDGDFIVSIYPLQSAVSCPEDLVPNQAIDFDPSNIPLAQVSFSQATLLAKGFDLSSSYAQPIDFIFSNTSVASGSSITVGNYYIITIKRSGSVTTGQIGVATGAALIDNAKLTIFNGTSWTDYSNECAWFQVWTDSVKCTDGSFYEAGHESCIEKTYLNSSGIYADYSLEKQSFAKNNKYYALLNALVTETDKTQDDRTGNYVYSKKEYLPSFSLVLNSNLSTYSNPFTIAEIQDKNIKTSQSNSILSELHFASLEKNNIYIRIIDDVADPRFDALVLDLVTYFENGTLEKAKFTPITSKPSIYYRVAAAKMFTMLHGDINNDGQVDELDIIESNNIDTFNFNQISSLADYNTYTNPYVIESGITFDVVNSVDAVTTSGSDGYLLVDPTNPAKCSFSSASTDFSVISSLTSKFIKITSSINLGNIGKFKISTYVSTNVINLTKPLLSEEFILKSFRADINYDGYANTTDANYIANYVNKTPTFPPVTSPATRIGTSFKVLKLELEAFSDRNDDYASAARKDIHAVQDIFTIDNGVAGIKFNGYNFGAGALSFTIDYQSSWIGSNIEVINKTKIVECLFDSLTNTNNTNVSSQITKQIFPDSFETRDPGTNDSYIPNNLIIGNNGQLLREDLSYFKVDFETNNIVLEIPAGTFPSEKSVDLFSSFIYNNSNGKTYLGYPAMRFADGTFIKNDALTKNQLKFSVSVQSYAQSLDGYDVDGYYGLIIDGNIGVYVDASSGLLKLNFHNLSVDTGYKTLTTRINVAVFAKKAGFNNKDLIISTTALTNILGL